MLRRILRHNCSFRRLHIPMQIVYLFSIHSPFLTHQLLSILHSPWGNEDVRIHFFPALVAVNKMKLLRNSPGLQWLLCLRESAFLLYTHFVFESSFSSSLLNTACSNLIEMNEPVPSVEEEHCSVLPQSNRGRGWLLDMCVFAIETVYKS